MGKKTLVVCRDLKKQQNLKCMQINEGNICSNSQFINIDFIDKNLNNKCNHSTLESNKQHIQKLEKKASTQCIWRKKQ